MVNSAESFKRQQISIEQIDAILKIVNKGLELYATGIDEQIFSAWNDYAQDTLKILQSSNVGFDGYLEYLIFQFELIDQPPVEKLYVSIKKLLEIAKKGNIK